MATVVKSQFEPTCMDEGCVSKACKAGCLLKKAKVASLGRQQASTVLSPILLGIVAADILGEVCDRKCLWNTASGEVGLCKIRSRILTGDVRAVLVLARTTFS